jgi:hypothetical protein
MATLKPGSVDEAIPSTANNRNDNADQFDENKYKSRHEFDESANMDGQEPDRDGDGQEYVEHDVKRSRVITEEYASSHFIVQRSQMSVDGQYPIHADNDYSHTRQEVVSAVDIDERLTAESTSSLPPFTNRNNNTSISNNLRRIIFDEDEDVDL